MRQKRKARASLDSDPASRDLRSGRAEETESETATESVRAERSAERGVEAQPEDDVEDLTPSATGRLDSIVESLVFAADRPITVKELKRLCKERDESLIEQALASLAASYAERGIVLLQVGGAWQFRTNPQNAPWVTQLVAGRPVRLTRAQLETLAIVAYRQPITKPEVEEIRGVDTSSSIHVLLERNLIRIIGKKEEPGRPMLYGTTREFLEFFQLNDLRDLPSLREFAELTEDSQRELEKLGEEEAEDLPDTGTDTDTDTDSVSDTDTDSVSDTDSAA
jgi:segregation and condensation protein B